MIARNLPDDTMALTDIQDRAPIFYHWGLPLHLAYEYATIYVTKGEGTYAHENIKVNKNSKLDDLSEVSRSFFWCDEWEREDWGVDKNTPEGQVCDCSDCKELSQYL